MDRVRAPTVFDGDRDGGACQCLEQAEEGDEHGGRTCLAGPGCATRSRPRGVARGRHEAATTRHDVTNTALSEATTGNRPPARRRVSDCSASIETLAFPRRSIPLLKSSPTLTRRKLPLARQGRFSV